MSCYVSVLAIRERSLTKGGFPDLRYRLRALVAKRDWNEIEEIAKNRKSPIGWEVSSLSSPPLFPLTPLLLQQNTNALLPTPQPFFNQTLQAGNQRLAATFVPKCVASGPTTVGEAARMYERCGMRVRAAEEAARARDPDPEFWARLLEAAGGRATQDGRDVDRLAQQIGVRIA